MGWLCDPAGRRHFHEVNFSIAVSTEGGTMSEATDERVREIIINELGVEAEKVTDCLLYTSDAADDLL